MKEKASSRRIAISYNLKVRKIPNEVRYRTLTAPNGFSYYASINCGSFELRDDCGGVTAAFGGYSDLSLRLSDFCRDFQ